MKSSSQIMEWFAKCEVAEPWSFVGCGPSVTGKWTHGYHRYPAKFIPQLVERLLDEYVKGRVGVPHVNDPFMGCGTTVVSAVACGYLGSGTDINPLAELVTLAKACPVVPSRLEAGVGSFLSAISPVGGIADVWPMVPAMHLERLDSWFHAETRDALACILSVIHEVPDAEVRRFFLVAFSHVLKTCSVWHQGSTKPYRDKSKRPVEPRVALERHLRKMVRGNASFWEAVPSVVKLRAREYVNVRVGSAACQPVGDGSVDIVISSSPYVTSYEYADLHQLSTMWLGYAEDLRAYRERFIGTAYKRCASGALGSALGRGVVSEMGGCACGDGAECGSVLR